MKKVLIIDEEVPFPPNTGKRIRTFNLLKRLQQNHSIVYLCYDNKTSILPELKNVTFIQLPSPVLEQKGIPFYSALLRNIFSSRPYTVDRHCSPLMQRTVASLLEKGGFDLIHCEWTPYTENIKTWLSQIPSVMSAHNIETQIWHRYCLAEKNLFKKLFIFTQWKKMDRYERKASKLYGEVIAVSDLDKKVFHDVFGCSRVTVVPNGVDEVCFSPGTEKPKPHSLIFTGSMDWRPNQDGVVFFLRDIFPLIQKELPESTLTIAGREPPRWLTDLGKKTKGVTLTGTVEDIRPFIFQSALVVVPLRIGGGSRLKILEALSMEKTVLSTSIGAEGLNLQDEEHLIIKDTPDSFASAAVDMLANPEKYSALGYQGRKRVLEQYTWDSIGRLMEQVWARAATN